jgi:hypothetical protein
LEIDVFFRQLLNDATDAEWWCRDGSVGVVVDPA